MSKIFRSPLAKELERFVAHRRMLGHSYHRAVATLKSFDRYVSTHSDSKRTVQAARNLDRGRLLDSVVISVVECTVC